MVKRLLSAFPALMATAFGVNASAAAAPVRPIVILFATGVGSSAIETKSDSKDGLTTPDRIVLAARAVRDRLNDSNAVEAVLYAPDTPMFLRAVSESHIKLENPGEPSESQRAALGKAAGAIYVLSVTAQVPAGGSGLDIMVRGTDLDTKKVWTDHALMSSSNGSSSLGGSADSNALPSSSIGPRGAARSNILLSAANTLVQRLLIGPLGDYSRPAPPPSLLPTARPPSQAPVVAAAPATRPAATRPAATRPAATPPPSPTGVSAASDAAEIAENAMAARQQADALLSAGDPSGAIMMLRHAINQSPMTLPLRLSLARAYLAANRGTDAASEARRALTLLPRIDRANRLELTGLIAQAYAQNGDTTAARAAYEEILAAQPGAQWARLALADILVKQNRPDAAEALYREVLRADPADADAALGMARLLAARGDYDSALRQLNTITASDSGGTSGSEARFSTVCRFFDEGTSLIGTLMTQNRAAWEAGTLTREALYKATSAESVRAAGLTRILKAVPPPPGSAETLQKAYKRRVYAASLLSQAIAALLNFIETSDADSGATASLQVTEFQKELSQAQDMTPLTTTTTTRSR